MSNRYAKGMGLGFRCSNAKERKWLLHLLNQKIPSIIKRKERFPDRDLGDIIGSNIGILGVGTRDLLTQAIRLRKIRDIEPTENENWFSECYVEDARAQGRMISAVLFNTEWYLASGSYSYMRDIMLVVHCLWEDAEPRGNEAQKDAMIKLMVDTDLDDGVIRVIKSVRPELDVVDLRTVADFEMACDG